MPCYFYYDTTYIGSGCQNQRSWWSRPRRPPLSLVQSSFLPLYLVDSPGGLGRARSPAAKHFDAIYTVNRFVRPFTVNGLTKSALMFNVLQKSAWMQSSATVGRTDTTDYRPCIALKSGGPCTFGPPLPESGGSVPQDPHRITATVGPMSSCVVLAWWRQVHLLTWRHWACIYLHTPQTLSINSITYFHLLLFWPTTAWHSPHPFTTSTCHSITC